MHRHLALLILASACSLHAGSPAPVDPEAVHLPPAGSPWCLSIGAQWRQIGTVDWQTGSAAAAWSLPWMAGRGSNHTGASVPSGIGDHFYSDGYVNQDPNTGTTGDTWFWGYNNASQVQGTDILFHSAGGGGTAFRASSSSSVRNPAWSDDLAGTGAFARLESPAVLRCGCLGMSLEFGYSWAQADTSRLTRDVFHAQQTSTATSFDLEDRYDASGILIPQPGHAGTFAGPGPLIPGAPSSRRFIGNDTTQTVVFSSDVRESFEVNLHTVSLGPRLSAQCCQRVRLGVSTGLAVNVADWDAGFVETLTFRQNGRTPHTLKRIHASESGTDVLAGFYLELAAQVQVTDRVSAYAGGRYDWSDSLSAEVGPSHLSFDPGGWSVLLGLTVAL